MTRKRLAMTLLLLAGLFLVGCDSISAPPDDSAPTLVDRQGDLTVSITPLNLKAPGETLDFNVGLSSRTTNLNYRMSALATLTADTGRTVRATVWTITYPQKAGGFHIEGTLGFPAKVDGVSITDGATKLTLTLVNVAVPKRIYIWELK